MGSDYFFILFLSNLYIKCEVWTYNPKIQSCLLYWFRQSGAPEWALNISHGEGSHVGASFPRQGWASLERSLLLVKALHKDPEPWTHRWQAGVPGGCVVTAGTNADVTVVNLGCTQDVGRPRVLQFFILLSPQACQHLQLRFTHLAGLIVSPVIFLINKRKRQSQVPVPNL